MHYVVHRNSYFVAKKLKKDWVEKAKIKSKWKLQKKREDIQTRVLPEETEVPPEPPKRTTTKTITPTTPKPTEEPKPNLRELTRQAYSTESLHTFKADPLKQHKGRITGEKGRGQPNMKLRMNAMLEKIKQQKL